MTGQLTARPLRVTEHHKARARLILLTAIGIACPPLAEVRSVIVWVFYAVFLILYALWALRLTRNFSGDRRLGYLLVLTDTAVLLPLLAWAPMTSMKVLLALVAVAGFVATCWADRINRRIPDSLGEDRRPRRSVAPDTAARRALPVLERALRVRLRVMEETQTRFALVVLRIIRLEEMRTYYGHEEAEHLTGAVIRRCLRLLGADAQHFVLPGGRVAFVFSTGSASTRSVLADEADYEWIDPYDIETLAMTLGRRACEHLIDGHKIECAVGWASAPADGIDAEDLMYAAESGAQSSAAFRRVAGSNLPVPDKTRAVAG